MKFYVNLEQHNKQSPFVQTNMDAAVTRHLNTSAPITRITCVRTLAKPLKRPTNGPTKIIVMMMQENYKVNAHEEPCTI